MHRLVIQLLLLIALIVPEPLWAAVLMPATCGCEHGGGEAHGDADDKRERSPCCPRMKAAADASRDGFVPPADDCCCGVDQPQLPVGLEPPVPRIDRPDADVDHVATLPSRPWSGLVVLPPTHDVAWRPPARAPPPRALQSVRLHLQHCVWRL